MSERRPDLDKRVIRLPDGRRLVFYRFPEARAEEAPQAPRPERTPASGDPGPPGEER
ncbi:MAG TPA: hypothetical protein VFR85_18170 [Anaeromyxobacteraceae bacterium]|nr:hypothetical protein [Anaeromyxobacteraceae bacterium]